MSDRDVAREIKKIAGAAFMRLIRLGDDCRDLQVKLYGELGRAHPWLSHCYLCGEYECVCTDEARIGD
jgi:hypothetical protein